MPLSSPVLELLRDLPRVDGNPYVPPGHIQGRPLVNVDKAWCRIRNRAGVNDVRIHDLRRTVGSWLATSGKSLLLIGKVLGHKSTKSTEVYARLAEDAARKALESHGKQVIGLAGKSKPVEVVEINKQR